MVEQQVLGMAQQMEDALDDELHKMNNMTEDDLEDIRRKRLEAMKAGQTKRKEWLAKGHGELRSLADEKEFFAEMKGEDKMVVHFYRNVFSHVPAGKMREVSHMLKAIHAQESRAAAQEKAQAVIAELRRQKLTRAAELVEESIDETLTFYAFPDGHWRKIRTNNPLERIMKEIRRRTRVVGAFPDGQSCLNLAAARLRHIAGSNWSTRKYMNMAPLFAQQTSTTGAVA